MPIIKRPRRGKARQPSAQELYERNQGKRETEASFKRLKKLWPTLRREVSAEAVTAMWFLFGDDMFVRKS